MDKEAMRQAIILELHRQGVEFAQVKVDPIYSELTNFSITEMKKSEIQPRYLEAVRITNQTFPALVPEGLENIRELDLEIAELIEAGLIERKDCGYALTAQ